MNYLKHSAFLLPSSIDLFKIYNGNTSKLIPQTIER